MKKYIHIFGGSGSGTTTIAQEVCKKMGYKHFDSDNYFWLPTARPFTVKREKEEYIRLLHSDLNLDEQWILSGSVTGWAEELMCLFDLVIFVYVPQELRIERLKRREFERYGKSILPGGDRYNDYLDFIEWAVTYDSGTRNGRSLSKHEAWMKRLSCPVVRLENMDLNESINKVMDAIS